MTYSFEAVHHGAEHAGESGEQLSVGAEMKLMVVKQQRQVTNFAASLERSQARNPCSLQQRVVQLARSDRGHLI